jgi:hypothetical protein
MNALKLTPPTYNTPGTGPGQSIDSCDIPASKYTAMYGVCALTATAVAINATTTKVAILIVKLLLLVAKR